MSLFFKREISFLGASDLIPGRTSSRGIARISTEKALRHSAVWACRRLRADLISTMPVDIFRRVGSVQVEMPKASPIFHTPGGDDVDWCEWTYSSQTDLDSVGNDCGVITQRDGAGLPARIELVPFDEVSVHVRKGRLDHYRIGGEKYDPVQIWHERQFTAPGLPIGLSPIAHAAMSIGGYLSAQEFALDWFAGGGIPSARLKNTAKTIDPKEAAVVKQRFKETVGNGDLFVHGQDWDYETISAKASEASFIEQMKFGIGDICRFMGVPGDMIDAESSTGSITYANITQRNLQLLIMNINPALVRREKTFSRKLLPQPRYLKFNRGALLEMDLKSRYEAHKVGIDGRFLAPSEARESENRAPFTDDQIAEFALLFPARAPQTPAPKGDQA